MNAMTIRASVTDDYAPRAQLGRIERIGAHWFAGRLDWDDITTDTPEIIWVERTFPTADMAADHILGLYDAWKMIQD
jgi:hypothetical protein